VGYLMLGAVKEIDFDNITEGVPAFLTIAAMPLTYSIGNGLTLGILSYVIINLLYNLIFARKKEEKVKVSWIMYVLAIIFILKIAFL
ncbi:MAG: NCS2 family permease, partial [Clostridium celatum]|nr:NCS2 family permease [Clostridium celatum]